MSLLFQTIFNLALFPTLPFALWWHFDSTMPSLSIPCFTYSVLICIIMEAGTAFTGDVDKTQIPPLNQKRILAFVNHFLISTCTFLNEFALNCETKFVQLERQLQRTEAALIILESKLASIPTDNEVHTAETVPPATPQIAVETETSPTETVAVEAQIVEPPPPPPPGVRVSEDVRYRKYFKMLQVGVPAPAVKQKMQAEGLQPQLLE